MEKIEVKNLIIGFGKAGKTLAADLAKHGKPVILVERDDHMYGGTCINVGCIPSKKLIAEGLQHADCTDKDVLFGQAMKRKDSLISALRNANYHKVADLEQATVINATASFTGRHTVELANGEYKAEVMAERIFINTGTAPNRLQIEGADSSTRANRGAVATSVFTTPTLSHIGLTEQQAVGQNHHVIVKRLPAAAIPKARVLDMTDGLLKAVVDADTGEVLGVTLFCAESHEMINLFKVVIDNHIPAAYVRNMIFTHPTMAEGLNDLFA